MPDSKPPRARLPSSAATGSPAGLVLRPAKHKDAVAVAALLTSEEHLDTTFELGTTWVAEDDGHVVATARVRRLADGGSEIAGVVVARERRGEGLGETLAIRVLEDAPHPVWALALAPGFFGRLGFREVSRQSLPVMLEAKAQSTCASAGFVPMALA